MADSRIAINAKSGAPAPLMTAPKKRNPVGVRFPDGRIIVPPNGVSAEDFARWNGIELAPRSRDTKPPRGLPHAGDLSLADDESLDSARDEIVYESSRAVPAVSGASVVHTPESAQGSSDIPGTAATGSDRVLKRSGYTPLRAVSRKYGNRFLGQLALVRIDGTNYVKNSDLEAVSSKVKSRGKTVRQAGKSGAAAKVSTEIKSAQEARRRAWDLRRRRLEGRRKD